MESSLLVYILYLQLVKIRWGTLVPKVLRTALNGIID